MRHVAAGITILIVFFAAESTLFGAEHFGVEVYPDAQLDQEETAFLRNVAGADGYFFRSGDGVGKVIAFYANQTGLTSLGRDDNGGRFVREGDGETVYVDIDSPWQPSKGGEMSRDTRIIVVRE